MRCRIAIEARGSDRLTFALARSDAESDFTSAIKPIEKAAGVVVGGRSAHAAK